MLGNERARPRQTVSARTQNIGALEERVVIIAVRDLNGHPTPVYGKRKNKYALAIETLPARLDGRDIVCTTSKPSSFRKRAQKESAIFLLPPVGLKKTFRIRMVYPSQGVLYHFFILRSRKFAQLNSLLR